MQSRKTDTDVDNKHMDTKRGKHGEMKWEIGTDIYILLTPCEKLETSENLLYSKHRELCSMLCGDLNGKEIKKEGISSVQFSCSVMSDFL